MTIKSQAVQQHSRLGVEILPGCDLTRITQAQILQFKQSLWEHGVVVVKRQNLTAPKLKEFTQKTFGNFPVGGQSQLLPSEIDPDLNFDWQDSGVVIMGNPKGLTQEIVPKASWQWHQDKNLLPTEKNWQ